VALRQAKAFLAARGIGLVDAGRADLEAFLGDLLTYRAASTAATNYKVPRFLYRWLDEEDEIDRDPTAKMKIIGYRDLATLLIAIERDHHRRHTAHIPTKEAAIVVVA
jgi:site-specific recombinase XerD